MATDKTRQRTQQEIEDGERGAVLSRPNTTTIRVSNEFKARLGSHGQFGERFEDILIRLLGDKFMNTATGDKTPKSYPKDFVDSKATKKKRREK